MFYRQHTDGTRDAVPLGNLFSTGFPAPCWIIGGGPSLEELPVEEIARSPIAKFAMNLAGSGLLRPNFWTSYDPTARFHRSIYLDPSIIKFVHGCRAMDLVPESTLKVCEAPATLFFKRDRQRGFGDFLTPADSIADWQDSLIQTIDIAYRLGFRKLFLAGCEMFIPPSESLQLAATEQNVAYQPGELLRDFLRRCEKAGMRREELERHSTGPQYHFDEHKPLAAAVQTDFHYFRVVQYLRLARRSIALAGLELISVTPRSRLNDCFPFHEATVVLDSVHQITGDPAREITRGRYTQSLNRTAGTLGPMRDFPPHFWETGNPPPAAPPPAAPPRPSASRHRLRTALAALPEIPVDLNEQG